MPFEHPKLSVVLVDREVTVLEPADERLRPYGCVLHLVGEVSTDTMSKAMKVIQEKKPLAVLSINIDISVHMSSIPGLLRDRPKSLRNYIVLTDDRTVAAFTMMFGAVFDPGKKVRAEKEVARLQILNPRFVKTDEAVDIFLEACTKHADAMDKGPKE